MTDPTSAVPAESAKPESSADLAGVPDGMDRLWTPHRMVYIGGENKPKEPTQEHCPFCRIPQRPDAEGLIVHRGSSCYVVLNLYPYSSGHLLVCPYRHIDSYPALSAAETAELGRLSQDAIRVLQGISQPRGFNLGINQGALAGAGIPGHLHQHVVPRWQGDANFMPIIARTRALPQLLSETRDRLAAGWQKYAAGQDE